MTLRPEAVGVHTGLEGTTWPDLRRVWRHVEELGVDWISVWDHFHSADVTAPDPDRAPTAAGSYEAVAAHAALALCTERVRCGVLVYCAGYRHPAVIANAVATIDQLSGGRAEVGLGAGWAAAEYRAYGIAFPSAGVRLDMLEEATACVRGLLRNEVSDFKGEHFALLGARCEPRPLQSELPIWVGGGGERRTLRIAARLADGWNVAFVSPEEFARKRGVLASHCAEESRSPSALRCSVSVGVARDERDLKARFGAASERVRPAVLMGSPAQVADHVGHYLEAGVDQVNLAVRAPWDLAALDHVVAAIGEDRAQVSGRPKPSSIWNSP